MPPVPAVSSTLLPADEARVTGPPEVVPTLRLSTLMLIAFVPRPSVPAVVAAPIFSTPVLSNWPVSELVNCACPAEPMKKFSGLPEAEDRATLVPPAPEFTFALSVNPPPVVPPFVLVPAIIVISPPVVGSVLNDRTAALTRTAPAPFEPEVMIPPPG